MAELWVQEEEKFTELRVAVADWASRELDGREQDLLKLWYEGV